jgi:5-methylcytosine-specific restriction protein A
MPSKPSRPCPGRGPHYHRCRNLIRGLERYCLVCSEYAEKEQKAHNKRYDEERDQSRERKFIHSPEWRKIRLMKLAKNPLCEECLKEKRETKATMVHHVDGNELNNNDNNHLSVCNPCHERLEKPKRWGKKNG